MSSYIDLQQELDDANNRRVRMIDAMEKHLQDAADALRIVSWDQLDGKGMIEYAQAHAIIAQGIALRLQLDAR